MYDQLARARDPVDGPVGEGRAHDHGRHRRRLATTWPAARTARSRPRCPSRSRRSSPTRPRPRWSSIGDFAPGVAETTLEPETGFNVFTFPSIEGSGPSVVGGGDIFVQFKDSPAADAFLEYLTTPEAAEIWAARGGFSSPNKNLDTSVYPDEITRTTAGALAEAETFRFDMSDLAAVGVRRHAGAGAVQALHRLRREPGRHRRDHGADGG